MVVAVVPIDGLTIAVPSTFASDVERLHDVDPHAAVAAERDPRDDLERVRIGVRRA
jgi:hypothetical protein